MITLNDFDDLIQFLRIYYQFNKVHEVLGFLIIHIFKNQINLYKVWNQEIQIIFVHLLYNLKGCRSPFFEES